MAAPATASAAAVAMAAPKPSLNVFAEPSPPWAVKTAVVIAIPKAPPSWRTVLNVPEAAPIAAIGTAPMTALCADGIAIERPTPEIMSGRISGG